MVDAAQNVREAEPYEAQRGLMPTRVEHHAPGIAGIAVRPLGPARRKEAEYGRGVHAEVGQLRLDRELRLVGLNRVLQGDVEHRLSPGKIHRRIERGGREMGKGTGVVGERAIRRERSAGGGNPHRRQRRAILVQREVIRDPRRCGIGEQRLRLRDVEEPQSPQWEVDVSHGLERHAEHHVQDAALRLYKREYRDTGRNLVGDRRRRRRQEHRQRERG